MGLLGTTQTSHRVHLTTEGEFCIHQLVAQVVVLPL